MRRYWGLFVGLLLVALAAGACGGSLITPPREATRAAETAVSPTPLPPAIINAPTATPGGIAAPTPGVSTVPSAPTLTVWVNENSLAHEVALRNMAANFEEEQGVAVEMRLIAPNLLPQLVETAVISDEYDLPDIIIHPLDYTINWAERGVWNTTLTAAALEALDADTFDPHALALTSSNGKPVALPSNAAPQLIIYRQDWFAERNLAAPNSYNAMLAAAETLYDPENFIAGFVVPTESNLVGTHRIFEQMALANGCQLIDETGRVLLLEPACQNALNFYYEIIHNYSPIGVQTDTSTRDAYLAGRAGLIMAGPGTLLQIAGLDPNNLPTCPECAESPDFLAQNSRILTTLTGSGAQAAAASFGPMTVLGITTEAEQETAVAFAEYWFNNSYETWLGVEPERKIPLRWGTSTDPSLYIDAWGTTPLSTDGPSLQELFGAETVADLKTAVTITSRWGFSQNQGKLIGDIYQKLTFSVVLQEMLSGYFDPDKTLVEAYNRVVDLIPNYPFEDVDTP